MKKHSSRRNFIKTTALGAGVVSSLSSFNLLSKLSESEDMKNNDLHIYMTGYDYPRIKAFFDKKITINGCTYDMTKSGGIGDMNTNAFEGPQSFDVSEIGIIPYILAYANDKFRDYTLLPIFPLKMFRHKSIFIRPDSGIKTAQDLKGKKIGSPGYSSSSLTWIRGMLQDEYGISPNDIEWVIASKDSSTDVSGKASKQEKVFPDGIRISYGTPGKDESELLLSGEVDALFHAAQPKAFVQGNPGIVRLFEDSKKVEQEYFTKTGIFPIMHAVAVKTSLLESQAWLAKSLFDAYAESKEMNFAFMTKLGWAYDSLPWYGQEFEETKKVMGANYWSYGFESNRLTLEKICTYAYDQGLIKKPIDPEDLFYKSSLSYSEK